MYTNWIPSDRGGLTSEILFEELPDEEFRKLPEDTILGHVADIEEAKRFVVQGLGFEVRFDHRGQAVFVSTGGYHHHLAFNIWNGHGAKRRDARQAGLESYWLSVPESELGKIEQRLKSLGYEFSETENGLKLFDLNEDRVILEAIK